MSYSILNKTLIFAVGAAIGSAVTWKFFKTKYEQIANDEINSVKEVYKKKMKNINETESLTASVKEAVKTVKELDKNDIYEEEEEYDDMHDEPFVIPPDEFGEKDEYEICSLFYYTDGVVTDQMDRVIDNVDELIGEESLTHFGEWEDDSVFVQNDGLKTYYEILKDARSYQDDICEHSEDE